eukprot:995306-Lingulodinium_polyedra.AAC.1
MTMMHWHSVSWQTRGPSRAPGAHPGCTPLMFVFGILSDLLVSGLGPGPPALGENPPHTIRAQCPAETA